MEQEPLNEYDPFAVSVLRGRHIIGHVPIELSRIIFFALEHGCEFEAVVQESRHSCISVTFGSGRVGNQGSCLL